MRTHASEGYTYTTVLKCVSYLCKYWQLQKYFSKLLHVCMHVRRVHAFKYFTAVRFTWVLFVWIREQAYWSVSLSVPIFGVLIVVDIVGYFCYCRMYYLLSRHVWANWILNVKSNFIPSRILYTAKETQSCSSKKVIIYRLNVITCQKEALNNSPRGHKACVGCVDMHISLQH